MTSRMEDYSLYCIQLTGGVRNCVSVFDQQHVNISYEPIFGARTNSQRANAYKCNIFFKDIYQLDQTFCILDTIQTQNQYEYIKFKKLTQNLFFVLIRIIGAPLNMDNQRRFNCLHNLVNIFVSCAYENHYMEPGHGFSMFSYCNYIINFIFY